MMLAITYAILALIATATTILSQDPGIGAHAGDVLLLLSLAAGTRTLSTYQHEWRIVCTRALA